MYKRYINAIIYLFIYLFLCGLIRDGLFTNRQFRFVNDPRLHDFQLFLTWDFPLCILSSFGRTDTIVFAKLNKAVARGG